MADDFSESTKRALANRVGNLCSRPECHALTSGPQSDPAKALNLGVAAHITAASPGGPRYDAFLSQDDRCSATNGIWLCQNCAKLIDNDSERFPVELLRQWKDQAEAHALEHVGKTLRVQPAASAHWPDVLLQSNWTSMLPPASQGSVTTGSQHVVRNRFWGLSAPEGALSTMWRFSRST